jgi:hypothetical protein
MSAVRTKLRSVAPSLRKLAEPRRSSIATMAPRARPGRSTSADGIDVFYREAGPEDAPVVLLIHGFPLSSRLFRNLIPRLSGAPTGSSRRPGLRERRGVRKNVASGDEARRQPRIISLMASTTCLGFSERWERSQS